MTSKTTTKATSPKTSGSKTSRKSSPQQSQENSRKHSLKHSPKHSVKHSPKKPSRINRQRRLQKQLQILLLERHSRRCIICHHPEREAIEEEFVHWRAPWKLAQDYKLTDYRTVYRHARAAGLLLQRRERLHSALDAFVESVDDVTFTGDTILRAMRAYSCIDSHGRWTEIPTQVQFSTSTDAHPPQPSPRTSNVGSDVIDIDSDADEEPKQDEENPPEERVTALDVLNVIRKYSNQAPRSDATTCAKSSAQASSVTEDEYDELEDDDADADEESEEDAENDAEEDAENQLEEFVTSLSTSSKSTSHNNTACSTSSKSTSRSDTTTCADSAAQALPRDVVRGQNPNDRSPSDRTDCAALPAQPAAPQKPKPDADGRIWHKRPGYPDQEISEPDAQGRVAYKIHMTTAAPQLPPRETDAQRAAELIYRSVIKKYGNP